MAKTKVGVQNRKSKRDQKRSLSSLQDTLKKKSAIISWRSAQRVGTRAGITGVPRPLSPLIVTIDGNRSTSDAACDELQSHYTQ